MAGGGRRGKGEGSIYQRQDGQWAGALDLGPQGTTRQRVVVYAKTQSEVRDKLREAQRAHDNGVLHSGRLTTGQWLTYWLEEMLPGTVAEGTVDVYCNIIRLHLVPTIGAVRLTRLTPADVSRLLSTLERKGYAAETRRAVRAVLRRALRMAEQQGLLSRNVAGIADGPKVPRREGRTLTPAQARDFLKAVEGHRLEAAYVTTLTLGLRRGEVLGLFWGDLDLDSETPVAQIRRRSSAGTRG
jgi:integrase